MFKDILDGMVTYLNDPGRGFSQSFTAVRDWLPLYELEGVTGLAVKVFAVTEQRRRDTRSEWEIRKNVGFHVVDRTPTDADIDAAEQLADEIRDAVVNMPPIGNYAVWTFEDTQPFNVEAMQQMQVFVHVSEFTMVKIL